MTGGSSGLGEATVSRLHDIGYSVVILDLNEDRGKAMCQSFTNSIFIKCDVADEKSVKNAIDESVKRFGSIHVVVNCACIFIDGPLVTKRGVLSNDVLNKVSETPMSLVPLTSASTLHSR